MAASIFDQPAILLLIAFIALVRWLVQKAKKSAQNTQTSPPPSEPIQRGSETQTEEERIRRFLEALGQPAGSQPPNLPPARRRTVEPQIFPRPPRLKTAPPPLPPQPPAPPPLPVELGTGRTIGALEPDFEVRDVIAQTSSEPQPEMQRGGRFDPRVKLATPQDLRTAIILREIFGPPRSMQPLDLTSGY